jgi:hypothetical protein
VRQLLNEWYLSEGDQVSRLLLTKALLKLRKPKDPGMVAVQVAEIIRKGKLKGHLDAWVNSGKYHAGKGRSGDGDMKVATQRALENFMRTVVSPGVNTWLKAHGLKGAEWKGTDKAIARILSRDQGLRKTRTSTPQRLRLAASRLRP